MQRINFVLTGAIVIVLALSVALEAQGEGFIHKIRDKLSSPGKKSAAAAVSCSIGDLGCGGVSIAATASAGKRGSANAAVLVNGKEGGKHSGGLFNGNYEGSSYGSGHHGHKGYDRDDKHYEIDGSLGFDGPRKHYGIDGHLGFERHDRHQGNANRHGYSSVGASHDQGYGHYKGDQSNHRSGGIAAYASATSDKNRSRLRSLLNPSKHSNAEAFVSINGCTSQDCNSRHSRPDYGRAYEGSMDHSGRWGHSDRAGFSGNLYDHSGSHSGGYSGRHSDDHSDRHSGDYSASSGHGGGRNYDGAEKESSSLRKVVEDVSNHESGNVEDNRYNKAQAYDRSEVEKDHEAFNKSDEEVKETPYMFHSKKSGENFLKDRSKIVNESSSENVNKDNYSSGYRRDNKRFFEDVDSKHKKVGEGFSLSDNKVSSHNMHDEDESFYDSDGLHGHDSHRNRRH